MLYVFRFGQFDDYTFIDGSIECRYINLRKWNCCAFIYITKVRKIGFWNFEEGKSYVVLTDGAYFEEI